MSQSTKQRKAKFRKGQVVFHRRLGYAIVINRKSAIGAEATRILLMDRRYADSPNTNLRPLTASERGER